MKKIKPLLRLLALFAVAAVALSIRAQRQPGASAGQDKDAAAQREETAHPDCPMTKDARPHTDCPLARGDKSSAADDAGGHDAHLAAVNARGERAMGFSQTETAHHFILKPDGGVIRVEVNDPKDTESRGRVRQHLAHIARMFAEGDFDAPVLVHDQVPPGVPVMRRLRSEIKYEYEETGGGALVRIATKNAEALAAIHDFLRFQITDHKTGDSPEVNDR